MSAAFTSVRRRGQAAQVESALDLAVLSRVVRREAEREPGRLVHVFENGDLPDERVTAADLEVRGNQLAYAMRRAGLRTGDRVAIMLRNHPEFVYGYVATARLGTPAVPVDPRARGEKLTYFLTFSECSLLITADYVVADPAVAATIRATGVRTLVLSTPEGRAAGLGSFDSLRADSLQAGFEALNEVFDGPERPDVGEHVTDPSTPSLLGFTSGTTGDPKAIEFGHDRMLLYRRLPHAYFGLRPEDVFYTGLSLTHGNAIIVTMMPPIWRAVDHAVFSRWFTASRLWDVCRAYGATVWSNLGGIATALYSRPARPDDRDNPVRLVLSAGMPRELWVPFSERFGVEICEWYGTMEGGFAYNPPGVGPVGSFGKPPPELLVMDVLDEDGRSVGPDGLGELVVRPANGEARCTYFKNPEASARKVRDGWLRTGDMVRRDAEGWLYFDHRREEGGLRRMGEFISESFIRRVIAEHPDVLDVHVYGVPARNGAPGETDVVAAVVLREGVAPDAAALFALAEKELERSHVPDFVHVVAELPRTASEKVQTRFLVEDFSAAGARVFARPT
jgi:acyl-coenzyme A synthetase/AMP-(fatty) acid ligase